MWNCLAYTCHVNNLYFMLGAGIHVAHGHVALPNNGIILTGAGGQISEFRCISGSSHSNVGHLFDINEVDITISNSDPFFTLRHSPGTVQVRSIRRLRSSEQGIYTCRIPDETWTTVNVNVGLYLNSSNCKFRGTNLLALIIVSRPTPSYSLMLSLKYYSKN